VEGDPVLRRNKGDQIEAFDDHAVDTGPARATPGSVAGAKPAMRLGDLLLQREMVTKEELEEALVHQSTSGSRLGAALVELGLLDERSLVEALAKQLNLRVVDLRRATPEPEALAALPESVARGVVAVPMRKTEHGIEIVVADPQHPGLLDELTRATRSHVTLLLAPPSDVRRALDRSYRALSAVDQYVRNFELTAEATRQGPTALQVAVEENAPVVRVVDLIITQALRDRASDIHIEPQDNQVRVRVRVDGALHDVLTLPPDIGPAVVSRVKIMADMNIVERRRSQDGQIETVIDGRPLDIRVATTPVIWGEKVVMRLLDKSKGLYRMGDLGMPPSTHEVYSGLVRLPFGMVICAGPTGSGKTTTLYATLGEINTVERNIMTIEDPVEYVLPGTATSRVRCSRSIAPRPPSCRSTASPRARPTRRACNGQSPSRSRSPAWRPATSASFMLAVSRVVRSRV
jgi:type IV pilus assembly protein PilB